MVRLVSRASRIGAPPGKMRLVRETMEMEHNLIYNCTGLKLSLGQYKTVALVRGLSGGLGLATCCLLLAILLLVTKKKTWENLSKRLSLGIIFSTSAYMLVVVAGTWYTHPPPNHSTLCTVVGILHFYFEVAMLLYYILTFLSLLFHVLRSAFPDNFVGQVYYRNFQRKKSSKLWEVGLLIAVPLLPSLLIWEPFVPGVPSYGSHGTSCWLHFDLNTTDCEEKKGSAHSIFVWVLIGTLALILCLSVVLTPAVLCHVYLKFRRTKTAINIRKALLNLGIVFLVVLIAVVGLVYSTILSTYARYLGYASWVQGEIGNPLFGIVTMILMGLYIHYTTLVEVCCRTKAGVMLQLQANNTDQWTNPSSVWDHRNVPSVTVYTPPLESGITSTTTEQTPIASSNIRVLYDAINTS